MITAKIKMLNVLACAVAAALLAATSNNCHARFAETEFLLETTKFEINFNKVHSIPKFNRNVKFEAINPVGPGTTDTVWKNGEFTSLPDSPSFMSTKTYKIKGVKYFLGVTLEQNSSRLYANEHWRWFYHKTGLTFDVDLYSEAGDRVKSLGTFNQTLRAFGQFTDRPPPDVPNPGADYFIKNKLRYWSCAVKWHMKEAKSPFVI